MTLKRTCAGVSLLAALILALWAVSLFQTKPQIRYGDHTIQCASVYGAGVADHSEPANEVHTGSDEACQDEQIATTGEMSLVLAPAAVLAMLGISLLTQKGRPA